MSKSIRFLLAWVFSVFCALSAAITVPLFPGNSAWEFWLRVWSAGVLKLVGIQVRKRGFSTDLPGIYIMNHQSVLDVITFPYVSPRKSTFVAKKEVAKWPFFGFAMRKAGCIFVDRTNVGQASESMASGCSNLLPGYSILVFPEGTRSTDGSLKPLKKGFIYLALQTKLPIIPVAQAGTLDLVGKNSFKGSGTIQVFVGSPIDTKGWTIENRDVYLEQVSKALKDCISEAEKEKDSFEHISRQRNLSMPTG